MPELPAKISRRSFLNEGIRDLILLGMGGMVGILATRKGHAATVWQIDPQKCTQCGQCATTCVIEPSAVKCVHAFALCGYCELCTGLFNAQPNSLTTAAENLQCPTGAIKRTFIEDPYYQYTINEKLCIACARCVKGCNAFGNGSLYLQIRHNLCLHCNECSVAAACPSEAIVRVPTSNPYIAKQRRGDA